MKRRRLKLVASPKQYPKDDEPFDSFYLHWKDDLHRIARSQSWRFRGSASNEHVQEAESEVHFAFWTAYLYWKPTDGPFGKLFWTVWLNRLHTHGRYNLRSKRAGTTVSYSTDESLADVLLPLIEDSHASDLPVYGVHDEEVTVISMLSCGYRATDVWDVVGKRTYYEVLDLWRAEHDKGGDA